MSHKMSIFFVLTLIASCCQDMLPPRLVRILFGVEFFAAPHPSRMQNWKACENVIEKGGYVPAPTSSRTWQQLWPSGSSFRIKDRRKGLWILPPLRRKVTKARHLSGVSLNRGLEWSLYDAVKLKPGLSWRSQDVRNS